MKVAQEILNLVPYKPGKPIGETQREYGLTKVYKLASNENPIGPSPKAIAAMTEALSSLHLYPDPACYDLTKELSKQWQIEPSWLTFGNGSNELIDLLIRIYCQPGDHILTTQAAFIAYQICAQAARVRTEHVPLKSNYQMDLKAISEKLKKSSCPLVFIPNPNNPTGTYVGQKEVEDFLSEHGNREDVLIIFDEAYNEFVRASDYTSALPYVTKYSNVCVMRTFSKVYGLAGMRIGVLIARPEVNDLVNRVRNPFNVNTLAQVAALATLQDKEYLKRSSEVVWQGLDYFYEQLKLLKLDYVPSQANFVFFDLKQPAQKIYQKLLERGVIMRPVANYGFPNHMRLSVGLMSENQVAMASLSEALKE